MSERVRRYVVEEGSISAHCCFEASVLDSERRAPDGDRHAVCECFTIEDAELVAKALNAYQDPAAH